MRTDLGMGHWRLLLVKMHEAGRCNGGAAHWSQALMGLGTVYKMSVPRNYSRKKFWNFQHRHGQIHHNFTAVDVVSYPLSALGYWNLDSLDFWFDL